MATFKKGLLLPGFYIGSDVRFSSDESLAAAKKILVGDDANPNLYTEPYRNQLREVITKRAISFFTQILALEQLYRTSRGDGIFWATLFNNWIDIAEDVDVIPGHARETVSVLAVARRRYNGTQDGTTLTALVDQFNRLYDEVIAIPLDITWPPAHLHADDLAFIANPSVHAYTENVSPATPGGRPANPTTTMMPLQLRGWLAWLICKTPFMPSIAFYMAPIAFFNTTARKSWYEAFDHQSKLCGTIDGFLQYTNKAFGFRDKHTVIGLLTPIFTTQAAVLNQARVEPDIATVWKTSHWAARMGMAIVLRKIIRGDGDHGLQIILFDPAYRYDACKIMAGKHGMGVFNFRDNLRTKIKQWAVDMGGVPIHEAWYGGYFGPHNNRDSVRIATDFMEEVTKGGGLPGSNDGEGAWHQAGFIKMDGY